ncbi:MAG: VTT domain-containing protein [Trueperaceae bacterium]|nr:VTT domain-containing protein [Trueperaceae bacterium]
MGTPHAPDGQNVPRRLRRLALLLWGVGLASYAATALATGRTPLDLLVALGAFLGQHPLGAAAYLAVYAVRPLVAFSASLLSVAGGVLYGPLAGVALVIVGANVSALVAYGLGRGLGAELAGPALAHPRLAGVTGRLRGRTFETVLTLRFLFAPYDAVNYLAGATRLRPLPFVAATAIGSLPGTIVFVLFGAGLGDLSALGSGRLPTPDLALLATSGALFAMSLLAARLWRRRAARRAAAGTELT